MLTIDPNDDRTVTLTWNAPTEMSGSISFNSAEFYVVEQSINNEEYAQVIIDSVQGTVLINLNHTNSVLFWCNYIV